MAEEAPNRLSDLREMVQAMRLSLEELGTKLEQAAGQLKDGTPPDLLWADQIHGARRLYEAVSEEIKAFLEQSSILAVGDWQPPSSTAQIESWLNKLEHADQEKAAMAQRTAAVTVLDRVLKLVHVSQPDFAPLLSCLENALTLRSEIEQILLPELHPAVPALLDGSHPLSALVTLVDDADRLDDDTCDTLTQLVSAAYDQVLAISALRGRLVEQKTGSQTQTGSNEAEVIEDTLFPEIGSASSQGATIVSPVLDKDDKDYAQPIETSQRVESWEEHLRTAIQPEDSALVSTPSAESDTSVTGEEEAVWQTWWPTDGDSGELSPADLIMEEKTPRRRDRLPLQPQMSLPYASTNAALFDDVGERVDDFANLGDASASKPLPTPYPHSQKVLEEQDIPPDATSTQIAMLLLNSQPPGDLQILQRLFWQFIFEDRMDLAFHLAHCMGQQPEQPDTYLAPEMIRMLICTRHVRYDVGALASQIASDLSYLDTATAQKSTLKASISVTLLFCAGLVRASILAPSSQAWVYLNQLLDWGVVDNPGLSELKAYCKAAADFGSHRQPLDLNALTQIKTQNSWEKDLDTLYQEVEQWCEQAPSRTMSYAPATHVWVRWHRPGGLIYEFLKPIRAKDYSKLGDVLAEAQRLSDSNKLDKEIHKTDLESQSRSGRNPINYAALAQLRQFTKQAIDLAIRWIDLYRHQPDTANTYLRQLLADLKNAVDQREAGVKAELQRLVDTSEAHSPYLLTAILLLNRTLDSVQQLFASDFTLPDWEPGLKHLLNGTLLADPEIELDDDWRPQSSVPQLLYTVLRLAGQQEFNWMDVLKNRSGQLDHRYTGFIVEYLERNPDLAVDLPALISERNNHLQRCREALERVVGKTLRQVESAVALGLLREQERNEHMAAIESVRMNIPEMVQFVAARTKLNDIVRQVEEMQALQIETVRRRLEAIVDKETEAYNRIEEILKTGDLLTANEYIDMIRSGSPLPESQSDADAFTAFFPDGLMEIERFLADREFEPQRVYNDLKRYARGHLRTYQLGPVNMYNVSGPQAHLAAALLAAWFSAKRNQRLDSNMTRDIFNGLGFRTQRVQIDVHSRRLSAQVQTEPVRDKRLCPVWQYGSGARGHYRLLCVWDRPTEEELLNDIGETVRNVPVIVFYFGRMTQQRRRNLARLCRERRRTCIVLDDTLLIYLCGFSSPRLPILFQCTLPFTFLEPYTVTAGVVPPEMFYGRQQERLRIVDEMGACFIYGGRQLGKTALLRDVERNFHDPEHGRIVIWLDLKAEGIGYNRSIDEIWNLLARTLKTHGVVPTSVPVHISPDKLLTHVEKWLQEDSQRRVLLLLDEADRFLESDGKGKEFQHATRIKYLMDRTDRRFKIVFAGLHNVQRTTHQSNHPLAHFSTPICIGPLLEGSEWREARALIEQPLLNIGCRFESPDLVTLILSQTNYYPSLIQLYCTQLLRHVMNPHRGVFDTRNSPPYTITLKDVNEVYLSQELRHNIRQRFNWSLQLDQRYEVLAHLVAMGSLSNNGGNLVEGFSDKWLLEQALTWWPQGFAGLSANEDMRALADEMVGLGILRKTSSNLYALRSPNVLLLMGTRDDIESELLRDREPVIEYEPSVFRSAHRQADLDRSIDHIRRSPLTAAQESALRQKANGVSIICGNDAAGMQELSEFLSLTFGADYLHRLDATVADSQRFGEKLKELKDREPDGTNLILVPNILPWNTSWVEYALQFTRAARSRSSFVRVVFIAAPRTTWQLLGEVNNSLDGLKSQGVSFVSLNPWHDTALRQWLEDCGFGPRDREGREQIKQVTGNWPSLLYRFYDYARGNLPHWSTALEKLEHALDTPETAAAIMEQLGLQQKEQRAILKAVSEWQDINDALEVLDNWPPQLVYRVLQWAELLRLVEQIGPDKWQVNWVVAHLLQRLEI